MVNERALVGSLDLMFNRVVWGSSSLWGDMLHRDATHMVQNPYAWDDIEQNHRRLLNYNVLQEIGRCDKIAVSLFHS